MLAKVAEGVLRVEEEDDDALRPVLVVAQVARHLRKLGMGQTDVLLLVVHAMLFMGAVLGCVLVGMGGYHLYCGIDVYQYNFQTQSFQRTITEGCICTGVLAIMNAGFFLLKQNRKQWNKASLKHRTPLMTIITIALLLGELVAAIFSMVMSYGTVAVLESMDKQRYSEDIGDQCDFLDVSQCHCRVLYVTGVETCNYVFESLPTYQTLVAIASATIVLLVSSSLVIILSCSLATFPHRLLRHLSRIWKRLA